VPLEVSFAGHGIRRIAARLLLPAAIGFGTLHLPETGGFHPAFLDQLANLAAVDLRPLALRPAWGEPNQPILVVEAVRLAVDPTVAEGEMQGLCEGDRLDT
jgi:hypothetical protein